MYPYYYHSRRRGGKSSASIGDLVIPFVSVITVLSVAGGLQVHFRNQEKMKNDPSYGFNEEDAETKIFEPGEHIISVLIDSPLKEAKQYEYHEGYKPIGIASSTYGKANSHDAGSCLVYVNESEVVAKSTGIKDSEAYFGEFGTPIELEDKNMIEDIYTVDFPAGTHILSIPIGNPTDYNMQYCFYEGYEPVGIATAAYGQATDNSSGGCILYVNTEDVTLRKEEDNVYVKFGTPKEEQKVKIKK